MENKTDKLKIVCSICLTANSSFFVAKNSCNIYKCQSCGLLFVWPLPLHNVELYTADYFMGATFGFGYVDYEEDKKAAAKTLDSYLTKIESYLPLKGKLLDIGAATGVFLQIARKRGWNIEGIEPVDWAAQKAREKGLVVKTGALNDCCSEEENFDVVTYLDVFEHLPDPTVELRMIRKVLKPNGLLVINTPDAGSHLARILGKKWHLLTPPEHLIIFNQNNLTHLLQKCDFEVLRIEKIGKKFTLQYVFRTLVNWQKIKLWRWLAKFLENNRLGRLGISINLRDNFFVIAQKKI